MGLLVEELSLPIEPVRIATILDVESDHRNTVVGPNLLGAQVLHHFGKKPRICCFQQSHEPHDSRGRRWMWAPSTLASNRTACYKTTILT